ncbi:MAG TPA: hypothetical protein VHS80_03980 [Chthoniobacterales bacterium]|nr:hypothetical protein [Chthoniobacterales bacterium]
MIASHFIHPGRSAAPNRSHSWRWLLCLAPALLFSSCDQSNVAVYRIPKESVNMEASSGSLVPPPPSALPKWTVPSSWKEQPLIEMRLASFKVEGPGGESADISVSSFPGDAGGLESNVNRWRGQVHQAVLEADSLAKTLERSTVDGVPAVFVDVQTPEDAQKPERIIGSVLRTSDRTWFVKMTGSPAVLQAEVGNFKQFVGSFRFPNEADKSGDANATNRARSTNDK